MYYSGRKMHVFSQKFITQIRFVYSLTLLLIFSFIALISRDAMPDGGVLRDSSHP